MLPLAIAGMYDVITRPEFRCHCPVHGFVSELRYQTQKTIPSPSCRDIHMSAPAKVVISRIEEQHRNRRKIRFRSKTAPRSCLGLKADVRHASVPRAPPARVQHLFRCEILDLSAGNAVAISIHLPKGLVFGFQSERLGERQAVFQSSGST